jgi:hypothetical protein
MLLRGEGVGALQATERARRPGRGASPPGPAIATAGGSPLQGPAPCSCLRGTCGIWHTSLSLTLGEVQSAQGVATDHERQARLGILGR